MNRRGFLKFLGLAPAATVAAPIIAEAKPWSYATAPIPRDLLIEAMEKAINPPMIIAGPRAVMWDMVSLFPGCVTWVDSEYDEPF